MRSRLKTVLWTLAISVLATVLVLAFSGGEKKLEEQITREYALHDAQYQRALGVMLGPPITEGNRFQVLHNGDRIFPSMLAAIRGAEQSITFETYIY